MQRLLNKRERENKQICKQITDFTEPVNNAIAMVWL